MEHFSDTKIREKIRDRYSVFVLDNKNSNRNSCYLLLYRHKLSPYHFGIFNFCVMKAYTIASDNVVINFELWIPFIGTL